MKKHIYYFILVVTTACSSCVQHQQKETESKTELVPKNEINVPNVSVVELTKSFMAYWTYYSKYAQLSQNFPALDEVGKSIDRGAFLTQLNTGLYIPLVVNENGKLNFKLAKIPEGAPKDIGLTIGNYANKELIYYKMEGKPIPKFSFKDLNGKSFTSENTKGKIVLFKCWFIACGPCVAEMPSLNALVAKYKDRDDILYISLASDQEAELKKFLTTTRFDYVTIPNQDKYMNEALHVQAYPTHYVINKKGILVKVVDEAKVMENYLKEELTN